MRRVKRAGFAFLLLAMIVKLSGCLHFRDSSRKVNKDFSSKNLDLQEKTMSVEGRNLHWIRTNFADSTKPLAFFIHGSPGASNNFNNNLFDTTLRKGYEMVSVDRPGFGYSEFGKSMPSLKEQAAQIAKILDLFPYRKVVLVGHSYGGPVIAKMAIDFPEKVSGLIIVAGSVDPDLEPEEWWRKPANSWFGRLLIPKSMEVSNQEIMTLKSDLEEMKDKWDQIEVPVYVIQGQKDKLVPPANADFVERSLNDSTWRKIELIDNVNHFIPFTQHHLITNALLEMAETI